MKNRIMIENGCTESCAEWMVNRITSMVNHMRYGCALIAYKRQDGTFRLAIGTLVYYEGAFGKGRFELKNMKGGNLVYWDVEARGWRNLLVENFLEWRPIV